MNKNSRPPVISYISSVGIVITLRGLEVSLVVEGVTQVRMLIVFAGQGLFPGPPLGQQLPLLAVPPLHTPVLEPDFDLKNVKVKNK